MKKSKRNNWLFILAVVAVISAACDDKDAAAEQQSSQKTSASESKGSQDYVVHSGTPGCTDPIDIEISGIRFSVPRYGTSLQLNSGENISNLHEQCDLHFIKDVYGMDWPNFSLSDASNNSNFRTTYDQYKEEILKAEKEGRVEILSDGVQKIKYGASEIYVLPLDISPTGNNSPVVFLCSDIEENRKKFLTQGCDTSYLHPTKIGLWYSVARVNYAPYSYIEIDIEMRKKLEDLVKQKK